MAHSTSFRLRVFAFTIHILSNRSFLDDCYTWEILGSTGAEMFALQPVRIAVLLAVCLVLDKCSGYPSIRERPGILVYCQGCGDSCHKCEYGIVLSAACGGIPQCAKGPDERCGGPKERYGTCGEGMQCICNRCVGCSTEKFGCSKIQNACLPHKSSESRDVNRFGRLSTVI